MTAKNGRNIPCEFCKKSFYASKRLIEKYKRFCSRDCQYNFLREQRGWGFKKYAKKFPSNRYKRIMANGKYVYEHRFVMEKFLGRPLEKHEHVHHLNEDPTDNRIKNLEIVNNRSHQKIHKNSSKSHYLRSKPVV